MTTTTATTTTATTTTATTTTATTTVFYALRCVDTYGVVHTSVHLDRRTARLAGARSLRKGSCTDYRAHRIELPAAIRPDLIRRVTPARGGGWLVWLAAGHVPTGCPSLRPSVDWPYAFDGLRAIATVGCYAPNGAAAAW